MKHPASAVRSPAIAGKIPVRTLGRRELLRALAATGSAVTAASLLPGEWIKPVVEVGVLPAHAQVSAAPAIDPTNFVSGVDNRFFPLKPGTTFFYQGTKDGLPDSDRVFVTNQTKLILGVNCIVVRDQAFDENNKLVEDTFDWYAQDLAGNVWYFGEDTKELDPVTGAVISTEGSWEAGVHGARPGIVMEAHPHVGDSYQQEFATGVAEDRAKVLALDKSLTVPYGTFDNLLLTQESSPLEPGVVEQKYYAADIGFIMSVMVKGGNETSQLVNIT